MYLFTTHHFVCLSIVCGVKLALDIREKKIENKFVYYGMIFFDQSIQFLDYS